MTKTIYLLDVDGTLLDTTEAIEICHIKAIYRAKNKIPKEIDPIIERNVEDEIRNELRSSGLNHTLNFLGINQKIFYDSHYTFFNTLSAHTKGHLSIFPDARRFLEERDHKSLIAISNSTTKSTKEKLHITGILEKFSQIHSEYKSEKEKPTPHMGVSAISKILTDDGHNLRLILIGDREVDLQFAENLKKEFPQLKIINILIKRDGSNEKIITIPDKIITSFDELNEEEK